MWLFKRKVVKRSEWMQGLLWAESLPRKELSKYIVSGGGHHKGEFYGYSVEGVKDYYLYRQNILDQI